MKTFFFGEKVPIIAPFLINSKLVSDFKAIANCFNDFFASKYTSFVNNSSILKSIGYSSGARLSQISFNEMIF